MCPGCHGRAGAVARVLGPGGHEHLGQGQHVEGDHAHLMREEEPDHPADLHDADAHRVAQRHGPAGGVTRGGPQPLRHHGEAHDDVADRDHGEVGVVERVRHAGGQDEHADDLDEGQQSVEQVVDVVGRGEPGEVDPGPPDGEEDHEEADDPAAVVADGEGQVELVAGLGDGYHEAEVEQQLERRRGPVLLLGVAGRHREEAQPAARATAVRSPSAGSGPRPAASVMTWPVGAPIPGQPPRAEYGRAASPPLTCQGPETTKSPRAGARRGLSRLEIPAATYSPRGPPPKYHRRGRA